MTRFRIGAPAIKARTSKFSAIRPLLFPRTIFEFTFNARNISTVVHKNSKPQTGKDTVDRNPRSHRHNWRRLTGFLSHMILTDFPEPLTDGDIYNVDSLSARTITATSYPAKTPDFVNRVFLVESDVIQVNCESLDTYSNRSL